MSCKTTILDLLQNDLQNLMLLDTINGVKELINWTLKLIFDELKGQIQLSVSLTVELGDKREKGIKI